MAEPQAGSEESASPPLRPPRKKPRPAAAGAPAQKPAGTATAVLEPPPKWPPIWPGISGRWERLTHSAQPSGSPPVILSETGWAITAAFTEGGEWDEANARLGAELDAQAWKAHLKAHSGTQVSPEAVGRAFAKHPGEEYMHLQPPAAARHRSPAAAGAGEAGTALIAAPQQHHEPPTGPDSWAPYGELAPDGTEPACPETAPEPAHPAQASDDTGTWLVRDLWVPPVKAAQDSSEATSDE
jgi:hypothetical protein